MVTNGDKLVRLRAGEMGRRQQCGGHHPSEGIANPEHLIARGLSHKRGDEKAGARRLRQGENHKQYPHPGRGGVNVRLVGQFEVFLCAREILFAGNEVLLAIAIGGAKLDLRPRHALMLPRGLVANAVGVLSPLMHFAEEREDDPEVGPQQVVSIFHPQHEDCNHGRDGSWH